MPSINPINPYSNYNPFSLNKQDEIEALKKAIEIEKKELFETILFKNPKETPSIKKIKDLEKKLFGIILLKKQKKEIIFFGHANDKEIKEFYKKTTLEKIISENLYTKFAEHILIEPTYGAQSKYIENINSEKSLLDKVIDETLDTLDTLDTPDKVKDKKLEKLRRAGATELLLEVFSKAYDLHSENQRSLNEVYNLCLILTAHKLPEATLRNYLKAISQDGYIKNTKGSIQLLSEITAHALRLTILRSTDPAEVNEAKKKFEQTTKCDNVPYSLTDNNEEPNPDAVRVTEQSKELQNRLIVVHHGFSSLLIEAKKPPTKEHSLLVRFCADVALKAKAINAKDNNSFPGKGVLISGIDLARVFAQDLTKENNDPFHVYKEAWPFYADDFDSLEKTHFMLTRGAIIVSSPGDESHIIDGVHYSLVIFNDHFHNKGVDVAVLVPTKVLQEKINGTTIPFDELSRGHEIEYEDINEKNLTLEGLIAASSEIGANVLNIGSGSCLAGGMCNADPLDSSPLYKDEARLRKNSAVWTDIWKHVHKGDMLNGNYLNHMTPEWEQLMIPFREKHDRTYNVSTSLLNRLDLFSLSYARWHKGFNSVKPNDESENPEDVSPDTVTTIEEEENPYWWLADADKDYRKEFFKTDDVLPTDESLEENDKELVGTNDENSDDWWLANADQEYIDQLKHNSSFESEDSKPIDLSGPVEIGKKEEDISKNPQIFRMLEEAYKWYFGGKRQNKTEKDYYPVGAITKPGEFFSPPTSKLYLDTFDITLTIDGQKIQLSKSGNWKEDIVTVEAWLKKVMPQLLDECDIRFYHRKDLNIL